MEDQPAVASAWLDSERLAFISFIVLAHSAAYAFFNAAYFAISFIPAFDKYRLRPASQFPSKELIRKCLLAAVRQQFFTFPLLLYIAYPLALRFGFVDWSPLPDLQTIATHVGVSILVEDFLFYWSHRLLHVNFFYVRFHKRHHEFTNPIGIASEYSHPVEALLGNFLPFMAGPLLMHSSLRVFAVWFVIRIWKTTDAHSGYELPFSPFNLEFSLINNSARHDYHHTANKGSYGSFLRVWDYVCGTDAAFNQAQLRKETQTPSADAKSS
eukprot:m.102833 g.102833  ORF g.102833 m.102833 type:complete len:269 (-) comp51551_c0_seq1:59-865(-)